jgi:hypothetical protein
MTLAGGCGAGSIWRAGEGQVKLWAAVACFALAASLVRLGLAQAGLLFGVGMTLAGGCGAGSIWRAGEGQVKLWAAVACFALAASLVRLGLAQAGLLGKLGVAVFLPAAVGWSAAILLVVVVMAAWWAFATWNEAARRFSAL